MRLKNKKIAPVLLVSSILITNTNIAVIYASDNFEARNEPIMSNDYNLTESSNGFKLEYTQFEDNELIYYFEEVKNNVVYTKKYIKENNEFKLIEELTTTIKSETQKDENQIIKAEINNITKSSISTQTILDNSADESKDSIGERAIKYHPKDRNYYFVVGKSSHVFLKHLSRAAIITAIGVASGGTAGASAIIGSIATYVIDKDLSNLYYRRDTYKPIKGKGKPVAKYVTRYYLDKNHRTQIGSTVYTSSGIYNK